MGDLFDGLGEVGLWEVAPGIQSPHFKLSERYLFTIVNEKVDEQKSISESLGGSRQSDNSRSDFLFGSNVLPLLLPVNHHW